MNRNRWSSVAAVRSETCLDLRLCLSTVLVVSRGIRCSCAPDVPCLDGQSLRFSLTTWMQTMGTALLAVERRSLARVWMAAQGSRSAHGLLYFAAVRGDRHHLDRRGGHVHSADHRRI